MESIGELIRRLRKEKGEPLRKVAAFLDIDIIIKEKPDKKFSYFDLADIQFKLESLLERKVDIGFADALRPHIAENAKRDMKLIYES